jgi:hypothetical protein
MSGTDEAGSNTLSEARWEGEPMPVIFASSVCPQMGCVASSSTSSRAARLVALTKLLGAVTQAVSLR